MRKSTVEDVDVGRVLCGRGLGFVLTACLAFSLGLAASSSFGTMGVIFDLSSAERSAEIAAELPASYATAAPAEPGADEAGGAGAPESVVRARASIAGVAAPAAAAATASGAAAGERGARGFTAPAGGPNGKCFVLIDRHNHKTGGTTMREIMLQNARFGDCHYWGYGQDEPHWSRWLAAARRTLPAIGTTPGATPVKLCLEAHFPVFGFMDTRVKRIAELREAARAPPGSGAPGCTVLLTTRVREPLSFYLSYFKWDIAGRQAKGQTHIFGKSFLDWAPPDLQSNAMWNAFATEYASRFYDNRYPNRRVCTSGAIRSTGSPARQARGLAHGLCAHACVRSPLSRAPADRPHFGRAAQAQVPPATPADQPDVRKAPRRARHV